MTSESKVLTVSYGAFSCTLEGFDDPFDTMKVIAEYFRDLAQNDRHFGAEPPQPDAAMLHRAAEREISRLIDSRREGVTTAPDMPVAGSPAPAPVEPGSATGLAADGATAAPEEPPSDALPVEPSLQDEIPKGFSARLARIRAASARPQPAAPPLPEDQLRQFMPDPAMSDIAKGLVAEVSEADVIRQTDAPTLLADGSQSVSVPEAIEATATADDAEAPFVEVDSDEADPEVIAAAPTDPVALTVDADGSPAQPEADGFLAPEAETGADLIATDLLPEADVSVAGDSSDSAPALDPAIEDPLPEDTVESALESIAAGDPVFADDLAEDAYLDMHPALPDQIAVELSGDAEPVLQDLADSAIDPPATADAMGFLADQSTEAEDLGLKTPPDPAAFTESDALSLPDADTLADAADLPDDEVDPQATPPMAKGQGRYERVSSRVVRIRPDDDGPDAGSAETPAEAKPDPEMTRIIRNRGADVEMSRLLRQAENVLADEENRRRLEAIALMKAAVVVAETDRTESETGEALLHDRRDAYREDLAQAVEPIPAPEPVTPQPKRRKTRSVRLPETRPGTIRPNTFSPPPLVLVTEQRIDRAPPPLTPAPEMPLEDSAAVPPVIERETPPRVALRTGRLTGAIGIGSAAAVSLAPELQGRADKSYPAGQVDLEDEDEFDEALTSDIAQGLIRFNERLGLTSTAEMLEAAAAFATCVEDRSQFTRPQLMLRLLAGAPKGAVSREDGLRSFGTLLRTGRIEKIGRGFYALAQTSRFLGEARRFT